MTDNNSILLKGLDGSNPLAFLAALGTLRTLTLALPEETIRMSWEQSDGAWRPRVWCSLAYGGDELVKQLHNAITIKHNVTSSDEATLKKSVAEKKKVIKEAKERLKACRLKGNSLKAAKEAELTPLEKEYEAEKTKWLKSLSAVVPSLELSLGRDLSASPNHFREVALKSVEESLDGNRYASDMLAAFGSDACADAKTNRIEASLFCFITGSGHQYFLDTVTALMSNVDCARLHAALLEGTAYKDEKLSMRWAPIEDRRYALMWADPTGVGNEPLTSWALNLLAYRGLSLIPASPTSRGFRTAGFTQGEKATWTWPIWQFRANNDIVRSLLSDSQLINDAAYRANRGVVAYFRSQRLVVGNPPLHKINFSPATPASTAVSG